MLYYYSALFWVSNTVILWCKRNGLPDIEGHLCKEQMQGVDDVQGDALRDNGLSQGD